MKRTTLFIAPAVFVVLVLSFGTSCKRSDEATPTEAHPAQEQPAAEQPAEQPSSDEADTAAATVAEEPAGTAETAGDAPAPADTPTTDTAAKREFKVDTASSKVDFLMEAPLENIHGVARKSVHGAVTMALNDLSTIRGKIRVDLDQLELFQAKRETADGQFPAEEKNAKQNAHMKTWFQISPDAPKAMREKNRWIEFNVTGVSRLSASDVTALSGDKRSVRALVSGDFSLHGRTKKKNALLQATFDYEGDDVKAIRIRTLRPIDVSLKEHDIQPRSAFDKLAQKTLAALGQKVAEAAPVKLSFTLTP